MSHETLKFDAGGLYILVSDIGAERQFHWGLYLATTSSSGFIFHLINNESTNNTWGYQMKASTNVPSSISLLVAVKIAVLDSVLQDALPDRLAQVAIQDSSLYGKITCRIWVKQALHELDDEGYIKLTQSVNAVEEEALDIAMDNKPRRRRSAVNSNHSAA